MKKEEERVFTQMSGKGGLLVTLLMTTVAVAEDVYRDPADVWRMEPSVGEAQGVSKEEVLQRLLRKREKGAARMQLIEEEIRCVENASGDDESISQCYELAQYKKRLFKQKYPSSRTHNRQYRQNGMMPNFDRMGMGGMRMPW